MARTRSLPFERPIFEIEEQIRQFEEFSRTNDLDFSGEIERLHNRQEAITHEIFAGLSAWERVMVARHPSRPQTADYIETIFDDFLELHGDRVFGEDRALVAGLATVEGRKVMLVGQCKGRTTDEAIRQNWGSPHPEGYRKALHKMKLAEKFHLPVVSLIDTKGAYPGVGAEERGQSLAIAKNLMEMALLRTPIVCVVIGEGGSGGALGIGVGDRVAILEHAYYSVISPEGCAAILWRDASKAPEAAEALKLTADALLSLGVVDEIIPEPLGGAHRNPEEMGEILKAWIGSALDEFRGQDPDELVRARYQKLRRMGRFRESQVSSVKLP